MEIDTFIISKPQFFLRGLRPQTPAKEGNPGPQPLEIPPDFGVLIQREIDTFIVSKPQKMNSPGLRPRNPAREGPQGVTPGEKLQF